METLIAFPETPEKAEALKAVMKVLGVAYEQEQDATEYLLSTKANRERLEQSILEARNGKVVKVDYDQIWK